MTQEESIPDPSPYKTALLTAPPPEPPKPRLQPIIFHSLYSDNVIPGRWLWVFECRGLDLTDELRFIPDFVVNEQLSRTIENYPNFRQPKSSEFQTTYPHRIDSEKTGLPAASIEDMKNLTVFPLLSSGLYKNGNPPGAVRIMRGTRNGILTHLVIYHDPRKPIRSDGRFPPYTAALRRRVYKCPALPPVEEGLEDDSTGSEPGLSVYSESCSSSGGSGLATPSDDNELAQSSGYIYLNRDEEEEEA